MRHVDEALLHAWLDEVERGGAAGALDAEARAEVATHLAACAECAARRDETMLIRQRSARVLRAAAPPVLELPGLPAGAGAPAELPARRRSWLPLAWAATIVMALGAGWIASALLRTPAPTPLAEERARGGASVPAIDSAAGVASVEQAEAAQDAAAGVSSTGNAPLVSAAPAAGAAGSAARERTAAPAVGSVAAVENAQPPAAASAVAPPAAVSQATAPPPPAAVAAATQAPPPAVELRGVAREELRAAERTAAPQDARARKAEPPRALVQQDMVSAFAPAEAGWIELGVERAEELLGGALFVLPDAAIELVGRTAVGVLPVRVRVTQRTPAGLVQVTQGRTLVQEVDSAMRAAAPLRREGIWLVVAAPPGVNADSLAAALVRRPR